MPSLFHVNGMALWSQHRFNSNDVRAFRLFDENSNLLGSYTAGRPGTDSNIVPSQVFTFSDTTTRYVTMQVDSNWGGALLAMGEVAFRSQTPEPSTLALLGLSVLGGFAARRQKR